MNSSKIMRDIAENQKRRISSGSIASFLNEIDSISNISSFADGTNYSSAADANFIETSANNFTRMKSSSLADNEARRKAYEAALEAGMTALDSRMSAIAEKLDRLRPDGNSAINRSSEK